MSAHEPNTQPGRNLASVNQQNWYILWTALLTLLIFPSMNSLLSEVAKRSFNENIIQFVTVLVGTFGAWRLCMAARDIPAYPSMLGAFSLALLSAVSFAAYLLHMAIFYSTSIIAIISAFIWAVRGSAKVRHYLPIMLFSCFLIPDMPNDLRLKISLPLQMITTNGSVELSHLFIPISSIGHTFIVRGQPFDVAPGCSGLNMWISFLFAFGIWQLFERFRPSAYAIMCICIALVTMALNVVRLFVTALVAYYISTDQALAIHANLEAILVPMGLVFLFFVGGRLRGAEQTTSA